MLHLLLRPDPTSPDRYGWLLVDSRGEIRQPPVWGRLSEVTGIATNCRVTLALPATSVLLTHLNLPGTRRGQLQLAAPYALEEELADDVETLHFALGQRDANGQVPTAVIARQDLGHWLKICTEAGLRVHTVTSEVLLLPWVPQQWSLLAIDSQILVRTGSESGFACEFDNLATELAVHAEASAVGTVPPQQLRLWACTGASVPTDPWPEVPLERVKTDLAPPGLQVMAEGLVERRGTLNLLQGPYRPKNELAKALRPWYAAAAALLLWFAIAMMPLWVENQRLAALNLALDQANEQVFRQAFPEVQRVVNARVQMTQRLTEMQQNADRSGPNFLAILAEVATVLGQEFAIRDLNYRPELLSLELTAPDLQALERLRQRLDNTGLLRAELLSAEAERSPGGGERNEGVRTVVGRLRITTRS